MIKPKEKKYSLTEEERSEYSFTFRMMKEYQMVAEFWANKVNWTRTEAMKRNALDPKSFTTNWDSTLEDGTFTATKGVDSVNKK